jgi:hypothetical protein
MRKRNSQLASSYQRSIISQTKALNEYENSQLYAHYETMRRRTELDA